MIRRAAGFKEQRAFTGDVFSQRVGKAGFANARLATEQHYLPPAFFGLLPAIEQQAHFLLASHQGRQRGAASERRHALPFTLHMVDGNRRIDAFDKM